MGTDYTPQTLGSGFASAEKLQASEDATQVSFLDTLSRTASGAGSNSMQIDLDMDFNDVLNVSTLGADIITLNGVAITATVGTIDVSANYNWTGTHDFTGGTVTGVAVGDLVEVLADTPASNDIIFFNGTNWVLGDIADVGLADPFALTVHATSATLVAGVVNEIVGAGTYTLPLADSVDANYSLIVELSDKHSVLTPTIQRDGTDTITDSAGTDTSIILDSGSVSLRFISDGSSDWRL